MVRAGVRAELTKWWKYYTPIYGETIRTVSPYQQRIMAPLYYVRAYHGLGMSHAALGNTQAAADAYAQFLSYWPRGNFDSERVQEAHAFMRDNPQLTQTLAR